MITLGQLALFFMRVTIHKLKLRDSIVCILYGPPYGGYNRVYKNKRYRIFNITCLIIEISI